MPEGSDYTPAPWAADDSFASARTAYDTHAGRSYADAAVKSVTAATDLLPDFINTDAACPVVILNDETSSMGNWPAIIFSKLPYVDNEAQFYFGTGKYAIAFGAFGDANCRTPEKYPVQMRPFGVGAELPERLKELIIEKGGGGQEKESSELALLYVDRNVRIPKAIRPILIIITDEAGYPVVSPEQAERWCKVKLKERMTTAALVEELKSKWAIYVILKPYNEVGDGVNDSTNRTIRTFWEKLVGEDHVAPLPDPNRVVDVVFGIFGQETGKVDEFRQELNDRQLKDAGGATKVKTALKALTSIHRAHDQLPKAKSVKKLPAPAADAGTKGGDSKSVTRRDSTTTTKKSKSLLDK